MNHKEFLNELQKTCHMDHHQCATLLSALQKLMVQAAIDQIPVTIHGLGTFTSHKHPEFIQEDENTGQQTLFPPRISYRMQPVSTSHQNTDNDQGVASELAEYAQMPYETVTTFLQALAQAIISHVDNHEEVEIHGLGNFFRVEAHQTELQRIAFAPDEQMKEQVNAPFSCFEPVLIREGRKVEEAVAFVQKTETVMDSPAEIVADTAEIADVSTESVDNVAGTADVYAEVAHDIAEMTDVPAGFAVSAAEAMDVPSDSAEKSSALANISNEAVADPLIDSSSMTVSEPKESVSELKKQSNDPQETTPEKSEKDMVKRKSGHVILYSVLIVVLAACLAFVIYLGTLYFGGEKYVEAELAEPGYVEEEVPAVLAEEKQKDDEAKLLDEEVQDEECNNADSVEILPKSVDQPKQVEHPEPIVQPVPEEKKPEVPKPEPKEQSKPKEFHRLMGEDGQPVTVTLNSGERLTIVSLNQYGDKSFWPYIFDVNSDRIKAPNLVQAGMKLYLPDPAFYDINPNSEESLRKAKNRAAQLLK